MFGKRKNSDKRAGISLVLALVLLGAGIFVGLQLGEDAAFIEETRWDIDISGEWIGKTTQDYASNLYYDYRVMFVQEGETITGISYFDMIGDREAYSEERIEGYIEGNTVFYEELETLVLVNTDPDHWCHIASTLTYQLVNEQETLVGDWVEADGQSEMCDGISGRIILTRNSE